MGLGVYYYKHQNKNNKMGGAISVPKTIWLMIALYHYYFFTVYLYFITELRILKTALLIIICILYFRMLVQGVTMFFLKKWKPLYGILFNALTVVICIILCIYVVKSVSFNENIEYLAILLYLNFISIISMIDSFYAWEFKKIVGDNTQGDKAVWYANDRLKKFNRINLLTRYINFIVLGLHIGFILTTMRVYDLL